MATILKMNYPVIPYSITYCLHMVYKGRVKHGHCFSLTVRPGETQKERKKIKIGWLS